MGVTSAFVPVAGDGDWAGWSHWVPGDPFEDHAGPFYARTADDGKAVVCGFRPVARHCNGSGAIHGGALMTFADFALFAIARVHGVTVGFHADFLSAGRPDALLLACGEVLRDGRSLVFVRGTISQEGMAVLGFTGTIRRTGSPPGA